MGVLLMGQLARGACPRRVSLAQPVARGSLPWVLQVMESVVKNCGQTVHDEVANKQTMEELKELLKVCPWREAVRSRPWGGHSFPEAVPVLSWGFAGT